MHTFQIERNRSDFLFITMLAASHLCSLFSENIDIYLQSLYKN